MPAGTRDHPSCWPTRFSYSLLEAHRMNFAALSAFVESAGMPHDQAHSQPDDWVLLTGAKA